MRIPALFLIVLSILLITGCRTVMVVPASTHTTVSHTRHIHPPLHPRHGFRHHHHHGVDLEFDTDIGAYFVLGFDGLYFYNNLYLRFYDGNWHVADRHDGHWRRAEHRHVPRELWRHKRFQRHLRHSPPPHAPAHGHRHHHHHGVDLVFDSGIGAYVVLGFDDLFFFDGFYMRFYDNRWHIADRHDGRWRHAEDRHVPRKLRHIRKQQKKGLFKQIKQQYREDHREEREYRERYKKQKKNGKREKHRDDYRDRDRDRDRDKNRSHSRDRDTERSSKGGLFDKVKKKHQEKEAQRKDRRNGRDRDDDNDDDNDDRKDRRGNGNRF